jgi:hypothetical protein
VIGCKQVPTLSIPTGLDHLWSNKTACVDVLARILGSNARDTSPRFLESEYMVHTSVAVAAFKAYYAYQRKIWHLLPANQRYYTSLRFIQGDDIWLSPFYGRDSVSISQSVVGNASYAGNVSVVDILNRKGLHALMVGQFHARPHWGKLHWTSHEYLRDIYPRMADFEALRQECDPLGLFLNTPLQHILGHPSVNEPGQIRQLLISSSGDDINVSRDMNAMVLIPGLVFVVAIGIRVLYGRRPNGSFRLWSRSRK